MRRLILVVLLACIGLLLFDSARGRAQDSAKAQGPPPLALKAGDSAPDFTLKDQNGKDISLHDFRRKKSVALAFYVFAFTGG